MADHPTPDERLHEGLQGWAEPDEEQLSSERPPATGVPGIDAVLDDLAALDTRSLAEHPAVFEHAHTELRRALDEPSG